jgi:hypothetical protein
VAHAFQGAKRANGLINDCKISGSLYYYGMSTGRNVVNFSEGPSRRRIAGVEGRVHHPPGLDWISPLAEVNEMITTAREALFVGRLDQDRFGDLLMPHVLGRLLHLSRVRCGGLVNVDFSAIGGHSVRNYGECALEMRSPGLKLVHVGGDVRSRGRGGGGAF